MGLASPEFHSAQRSSPLCSSAKCNRQTVRSASPTTTNSFPSRVRNAAATSAPGSSRTADEVWEDWEDVKFGRAILNRACFQVGATTTLPFASRPTAATSLQWNSLGGSYFSIASNLPTTSRTLQQEKSDI